MPDIILGAQVNSFVLFEPGLVVILFEVFEKLERRSFEHSQLRSFRLSDPSPVFTALDAIHRHFADIILFGQFLDGELSVLA